MSDNQFSLFDDSREVLNLDGKASYFQNFTKENHWEVFNVLKEEINWQQDQIKMYGKVFDVPRLQAWYGEKAYAYSGIELKLFDWIPSLIDLKKSIEAKTGHYFNSVLINYYRHGNDHVSWHSDDEPELGENPVIASLSLGGTRRFSLKHKSNKNLDVVTLDLEGGSLLIMEGELQHHWQHRIHKTAKQVEERINLTFRLIR